MTHSRYADDMAIKAGAACNLIPGRIETMSQTTAFKSRLRDSTGLAVTLGLHLGVAAIALLAVTVVAPDRPLPPIIATAIPDTPKAPPAAPRPVIRDLPVPFDVTPPVVILDSPPLAEDRPLAPPREPPVIGSDTRVATAEPPVTGPTQPAHFDKRHAASAQPPYPIAARRLGEEGAVIVHIRIGRDGRVLAATLAQSSGSPRLDQAAIAHALKAWRFTPALNNGEAVEAFRDITVQFRLADASG